MRDVIQRVIATEARARQLVAAARVEGERIVSNARKQAEAVVAGAREESRAEAQGMIEVAIREAEREKEQRLARVTADIEKEVQLDEATRQRAVKAAIRCVCEQRQPTEGTKWVART